jgi:hypothetical protein
MTTCIWGWGWAVDKANNNHVSHDYVDQYKIRIELHVSRQTYVANMYNVGQNYMCYLCATYVPPIRDMSTMCNMQYIFKILLKCFISEEDIPYFFFYIMSIFM